LIPAGEVLRVAISPVSRYALVKLLVRKVGDQLSKHGAASVHPALFAAPSIATKSFRRFQIVPETNPAYLPHPSTAYSHSIQLSPDSSEPR